MTVIPFDHERRKASGDKNDPPIVTSPMELDDALPVPGERPQTLKAACVRINMLERALITALRENATNWARAEYAERLLTRHDPEPDRPDG